MENEYFFEFPQFTVGNFGIFDTRVIMPHGKISTPRTVNEYEIEFVTDCTKDAKTYLNGNGKGLVPGVFICGKPGMKRQSHLHFKCFFIHITTKDGELAEFFESLPDYALLGKRAIPTRIFEGLVNFDKSDNSLQNRLLLLKNVTALLSELPQILNLKTDRFSAEYNHTDELIKIEKYIKNHCEEELNLETLAKKANLSPIYFHKIFTAFFGKTPARFVFDCRIEKAKILLLTDNDSILEISEKCGFSSQSYFNSKFKEVTGISPLKYRKSMLNKAKI